LTGDKLDSLLNHLGCQEDDLPNFGYYPAEKPREYITFEANTDLRDSESIPLAEDIHSFFLDEVKPHVAEAWVNLDSVKIGYEISFNKYFYKHQSLRSTEEVARDIVALEREAEGAIAEILGIGMDELAGADDA
jgi:type I restriction enzyme M protein